LILDASVALAWALPDEGSPYAQAALDAIIERGGSAPSLWVTEVLNGALVGERRRRMTVPETDAFVSGIEELCRKGCIQVVDRRPAQALAAILPLARAHVLTAYDASYLELAKSTGLPLATLDRALARAATSLGLSRWEPPERPSKGRV